MVLGDTVNTASRLQSIAAPGTVLVDDVTRRASEAAIAYEDAGEHRVKGREQPVRAWTALRVVAGAGGARRSAGLEAPFVGRERELSSGDRRLRGERRQARARSGRGRRRGRHRQVAAAVGVLQVHRRRRAGRPLAPGALPLLRRRRGLLGAGRDGPRARRHRRGGGAGVGAGQAARDGRANTCPTSASADWSSRAWRTCWASSSGPRPTARTCSAAGGCSSSGCPSEAPVVLVFEDLQWADSGLLEFIDYLLEWSAERPLFVLALGRPELLESRPAWSERRDRAGAAARRRDARAARGAGARPARRRSARGCCRRAEGVPLYAVETVRMLLDRGLLVQEGNRYRLTGEHRRARRSRDAAGAGRRPAGRVRAARTRGAPGRGGVRPVVHAGRGGGAGRAVAREVEPDARRAGGQAGARLQRRPAVRRARPVPLPAGAAADNGVRDAVAQGPQEPAPRRRPPPSGGMGEEAPELAEVLAAHFLDAADADPDASDARRIRASACETLAEAGERALSLALGAEAQRAFDRAAELAEDEADARAAARPGRPSRADGRGLAGVPRSAPGGAVELFSGSATGSLRPVRWRRWRRRCFARIGSRRRSRWTDERPRSCSRRQRRAGRGAVRGFLMHLAFQNGAFARGAGGRPTRPWPSPNPSRIGAPSCVRSTRWQTSASVWPEEEAMALRETGAEAGAGARPDQETRFGAYNNLADGPLQRDRFAEALRLAEPASRSPRRAGTAWQQFLTLMFDGESGAGPLGRGARPRGRSQHHQRSAPAGVRAAARAHPGRPRRARRAAETLEAAAAMASSTNTEFRPARRWRARSP